MKTYKNNKSIVSTQYGDIEVFKVPSNVNGHPRYVVHFLDMLPLDRKRPPHSLMSELDYNIKLFNSVGLSKYRAKWFGGGLVFTSFNVESSLNEMYSQILNEIERNDQQ